MGHSMEVEFKCFKYLEVKRALNLVEKELNQARVVQNVDNTNGLSTR